MRTNCASSSELLGAHGLNLGEVVVGKVGDDLRMDYTIMRCMTSGSVPQGVKELVCVYELQGLGRGSRGSVAWFGALV
jgi:hypothetical protein